MKKIKEYSVIISLSAFILIFMVTGIITSDKEISVSERRKLKQFPEIKAETLFNGEFMKNFEEYALDQFTMREEFRRVKAVVSFDVMRKKDNNDIYIADGFASKIDYPLNIDSLKYAADRFSYVCRKYTEDKNCNIYFSVIPDKNYFLAEKNGYPSLDYDNLIQTMKENFEVAEYIDITNTLTIDDYYKTDTHWRTEKIYDTAKALCKGMNVPSAEKSLFTFSESPVGFYGVYYGQSALPLEAEKFIYPESELFRNLEIFDHEKNTPISLVNKEKFSESDQYESLFGGSSALVTITNENALSEKELIIFRDSFGSSITTYLTAGYKRIDLVDIRYIQPDMIGKFLEFDNKDILFMYCTSVLNNSKTIK